MKTNISSIAAATIAGALCLSLGSCSESAEFGDGKYTVSLKPHKLKISSEAFQKVDIYDHEVNSYILNAGGNMQYYLTIDAENTPWKFTNVPDWIKISPMSGNESQDVKMIVDSNIPLEEERTVELALESTDSDWKYSIPITVNKPVVKPQIYYTGYYDDPHLSTFSSEGGTADGKFSANFTPSIAYQNNDDNWVSVTIEKNGETYVDLPCYTLHVTAKPNTNTSSRTAYVLLQYKGQTISKFEVDQYRFYPNASLDNSYLYIDNTGDTKTVKYTANFVPTVSYDDIRSWCNVSIDTNKKVLTVKVEPNMSENTRSGYIYVMYNGKKEASMQIYQYAFSVTASFASSYEYVQKKGGTVTVNYTANFNPTFVYDGIKDWCDVSINKSTKKVSVNVKPNTTGRDRSGYINMMYNDNKKASFRIYQEG